MGTLSDEQGRNSTGVRLEMSDAMDDSLWQDICRTGFLGRRRIHCFGTVDSTNSLALAMGKDGVESGTVLVAETQSKGRGRLGKRWSSPAGTGLYCSVILRPDVSLSDLSRITLAAGLATAQALDEVSGLLSMIKWPNDVLLGGKKVAGILTECDLTEGLCPTVALGIGINLWTPLELFPPDLLRRATSVLLASGRKVGKGVMLSTLLKKIDRAVERLEQGDFEGILDDWKKRDATAKQHLFWLTTDGRTIQGMSLGPDKDGCLLVKDSAGRCHHVMSGDITLDPSTLNDYFP